MGSFPLPVTDEEIKILASIGVYPDNMPFFQDSLFHYRLAKYVDYHRIAGDVVECGVYNGMSVASFAVALANKRSDTIYLYDSWEGFPETNDPKDGVRAATIAGGMKGSLVGVKQRMESTGFPSDRIVYRKGWFKDTFDEPSATSISLLHLDCDFYDSVLSSLRRFYDSVVDRGVILLDDYGAFPGCRVAFYEFCEERGIRPMLHTYDQTRAWWCKTDIVESNIDHTNVMPINWLSYVKLHNEKF